MTVVKFCGFRTQEEIQAAISVGCDLIGLNFVSQSPRYIETETASELSEAYQTRMQFVGVFQNAESTVVKDIVDSVRLTFLQFHGEEPPEYCRSFRRPYIKSFHVDESFDFQVASATYQDAFALMLDSPSELGGGSGVSFDWTKFPQADQKIFLSGGLNPGNVREAIETCSPWAVDVASGIEDENRYKHKESMIRFMNAVRYGS